MGQEGWRNCAFDACQVFTSQTLQGESRTGTFLPLNDWKHKSSAGLTAAATEQKTVSSSKMQGYPQQGYPQQGAPPGALHCAQVVLGGRSCRQSAGRWRCQAWQLA